MSHNVLFKMPRARAVSEFTVYPFEAKPKTVKLQSDNHCMIVILDGVNAGKTLQSKRFAQYPRFEFCHVVNGGKMIDTPKEIADQVATIVKNPTGLIVSLS